MTMISYLQQLAEMSNTQSSESQKWYTKNRLVKDGIGSFYDKISPDNSNNFQKTILYSDA